MDLFCYLCFVSVMLFFCSLQHCGNLLAMDKLLGSPVCDVFLCFCHFPMWCPGSGVLFECINS